MVDIAGSDSFVAIRPSVLMKVVPLSSEGLRIGRPLAFTVRDGFGAVLLARGSTIQTDKQLQLLRSREIFIDMSEMESVQRLINGQLDQAIRAARGPRTPARRRLGRPPGAPPRRRAAAGRPQPRPGADAAHVRRQPRL